MNKSATIIYRFCQQATEIFNQHLSKDAVVSEKIWLDLLELLSHKLYTENLLFRHYAECSDYEFIEIKGKRFNTEAWFYVTDVLSRRLSLANKMVEQPTNMHDLFLFYLQTSEDRRWQASTLSRGFKTLTNALAEFFQPVAGILMQHCRKLGHQYGEISKRRRLQYGPFWLAVGDNHAEVAEELALNDLLEALPVPLIAQPAVPKYFLRVVETLNERYALLRSCGLPPEHWYHRDEFSIGQLKQLKQLIKAIQASVAQGVKRETACRECFESFKAQDRDFLNFASFEAFYRFYAMETTAAHYYSDEFEPDGYEDISPQQSDADLLGFQKQHPQLFNPLTNHAFSELLVNGITLQALLKNPVFKDLKKQNAEYAALSDSKLLKRLQRELSDILEHYVGDGT